MDWTRQEPFVGLRFLGLLLLPNREARLRVGEEKEGIAGRNHRVLY